MVKKKRRTKWKVTGYYVKRKGITRWVALAPTDVIGIPFYSWREAFNYAYESAVQEILEDIKEAEGL